MGSFLLPAFNASIAMCLGIPQISNKVVPPLTFAAQWETGPFPLPIRDSVGLEVTVNPEKCKSKFFLSVLSSEL